MRELESANQFDIIRYHHVITFWLVYVTLRTEFSVQWVDVTANALVHIYTLRERREGKKNERRIEYSLMQRHIHSCTITTISLNGDRKYGGSSTSPSCRSFNL